MLNVLTWRKPVEKAVDISQLHDFLFINHFNDKIPENIYGLKPEQLEFTQLLDNFAELIAF